jgi:transposase
MKHVDMRSLTPEAQEERRRQVIGLRQAGQTYAAIADQVGLTPTGVFDICKRFAEHGPAGLKSQRRGPEPGYGSLLTAKQEAAVQALIRQQMPDELGLPFALWSRAAVQALVRQRFGVTVAVRTMGSYLARWGLHPAEAATAGLRAGSGGGATLAAPGVPGDRGAGQGGERGDLLG